jgi:hypothetical protein
MFITFKKKIIGFHTNSLFIKQILRDSRIISELFYHIQYCHLLIFDRTHYHLSKQNQIYNNLALDLAYFHTIQSNNSTYFL